MLKWISKKRNRKGFTLVELVVVIAILGILAAIAVPKLSSSRKNAAEAAHLANIRTLQSAANMFIADEWDGTSATWTEEGGATSTTETGNNGKWVNYIQEWPKVPVGLDLTGDYKVVIETDASITVTP